MSPGSVLLVWDAHRVPGEGAKTMNTAIIVRRAVDAPDAWTWAFTIDGEEYASGESASKAEATATARRVRDEWEHQNG